MVKATRSSKQKPWLRALLFVALLVLINLISSLLYFRLDFTDDKRYTLSQSTRDLLGDLQEVVTLHAYFSEDLPPELLPARQEFEELIEEYESLSEGQLVYAFENPNATPESEQQAQQEGVAPVTVNIRRRDQVKQMRVYMGVTLEAGSKKETIPFLQTDRSPEHALTTALKKLTLLTKPQLALLQGHGEPELSNLQQIQQQLSELYELVPFSLPDSLQIPISYQALLWIAPLEQPSSVELDKISDYLGRGGSLLLAYSPIKINLEQPPYTLEAISERSILNWLENFDIQMQPQAVVIDEECRSISMQQQVGNFIFNSQVPFPYFPIVQPTSEHPISRDLEVVYLGASVPINYTSSDSVTDNKAAAILLRSSERTGLRFLPDYINLQTQWSAADFTEDPQPLAIALEGGSLPHEKAKMVIFSDHRFIAPLQRPNVQQARVPEANILLVANAIDWLSDDTGLIDLRSKGISSRPLQQIEDSTKTILSYANMFAPILLVLAYAIIRGQYQLRRKHKWLTERA